MCAQWVVYLVRCADRSLYCGITNDLENRLIRHNTGKGAKYTKSRRPVELAGVSPPMTQSDALKLEYRIKRVPAPDKIFELMRVENEMKQKLAAELKRISETLMTLAEKVESLSQGISLDERRAQ